jgi:hypothetical protein
MIPIVPGPGFVEKRSSTPVVDTGSVPSGTMLSVPSSPPTGTPPDKPVVAVNTVAKLMDPQFILSVLGSLAGLITSIHDLLPASGPVDWWAISPKILLALGGAINAFLRAWTNTVTK